jgi:hypothetical protein
VCTPERQGGAVSLLMKSLRTTDQSLILPAATAVKNTSSAVTRPATMAWLIPPWRG